MSSYPFRKPPAAVLEGKTQDIDGTPIRMILTVIAGVDAVQELWCGGCGSSWGVTEDRPCECQRYQCPSCGAIDSLSGGGYCDAEHRFIATPSLGETVK